MSVPGIVQSRLDDEQVAAQVPLGGEDILFVTRTRTLIYRADGLLSDESVEEYSHEAERIEISEGRRKSAVELDYGIDGEEKFKVPSNRLYEALHPVLAGILNAADVTGAEETVKQTYQFSELTLVITSERVVKHVGAAVWDEDYEEYHFDDVTELDVEEGSVSSQIIIESDGRPQRIKTPSDQTREVRERIQQALLDYYDAASYEEFASAQGGEADDDSEAEEDADADRGHENDPLAGGVDPINANPPELDDDGAIIDDDASVTTDERPDAGTADADAVAKSNDPDSDTAAESNEAAAESSGVAESTDATDASTPEGEDAATAAEDELVSDAADAGHVGSPEEGNDEGGEADAGFADSGFESASSELEADDTEAQLEALTEAVERQNELLAEQQRTLETLIEELSRGR